MIVTCQKCNARYNNQTVSFCPLCAEKEMYHGEKQQQREERKIEAIRFDRKYGKLKFYLVGYYYQKKTGVNTISRLLKISRRAVIYAINVQKRTEVKR